jgi:hypothetical protein
VPGWRSYAIPGFQSSLVRIGRAQLAIKPAHRLRFERVGRDLGIIDKPALDTSQGPMFETRPPRSDALDSDAGLALRTARSLSFAWRQLIGKLSVRHSTNLRLLCPGVDLKSRRND